MTDDRVIQLANYGAIEAVALLEELRAIASGVYSREAITKRVQRAHVNIESIQNALHLIDQEVKS
jgi:hypothetical protein